MNPEARRIQRTYLTLILGNTIAASFIWGINTLFLLDAGLSNLEAFAANAFFTAGMVIFEVPTGVVADTWGRRVSYLLGTVTLAASTLRLLLHVGRRVAVLGVGARLGVARPRLHVLLRSGGGLARGRDDVGRLRRRPGGGLRPRADGVRRAMLSGSVAGGVIAQVTTLGVPFLLRVGVLLVMFFVAFRLMFDRGFTPERGSSPLGAMRHVFVTSLDGGLKNPPVRWVMLAAPFTAGVGIYAFYAVQPFLLELWGDPEAYSIAGLAAAIVAGSQIAGGYLAPRIRALFQRRTTPLILGTTASALVLALLGFTNAFWVALFLLVVWGMIFAAQMPIRQAYLNGMIPSQQRATVLSFDSLMGNTGGVVIQPVLGKSADVYSYSTSYVIGAAIQVLAVPLLFLSRREKSPSDVMVGQPEAVPAVAGQASGE